MLPMQTNKTRTSVSIRVFFVSLFRKLKSTDLLRSQLGNEKG
jgi:hypothetical protein